MKKLLLVLAVSGCACLAQADTMSFITVLSSPVGSFNKLETADPSLPAYGKAVNFCTQVGNGGVVELKGTQAAVLGRTDVAGGGVYLSSGTTLGKTDHGKYSLSRIDLKSGGNVKGGRLFANTVAVGNAASGRAEALYGNTLTIAGAKTKKLDVANGNSYIEQKDGQVSPSMAWSNEYQDDAACKTGSACAKQYLLKSKGSGPCANETAKTKWDGTRCVCPGAYDYYIPENNACCSYQTPKTDSRCWKAESSGSEFVWQNEFSNTIAHSASDNVCGTKDGKVIVPSAYTTQLLPKCTGELGASCSQSGGQCVVSCMQGQCTEYYSPGSYCIKYNYTITERVCLPGSSESNVTYKSLWDVNKHKNY